MKKLIPLFLVLFALNVYADEPEEGGSDPGGGGGEASGCCIQWTTTGTCKVHHEPPAPDFNACKGSSDKDTRYACWASNQSACKTNDRYDACIDHQLPLGTKCAAVHRLWLSGACNINPSCANGHMGAPEEPGGE